MVNYFRNNELGGTGEGQVRCYNCNNLLIGKIKGSDYILELLCPRCKARIFIEMKEPMSKEVIDNIKRNENAK